MTTTLVLPRFTGAAVPDARGLARVIAHDVGVPASWEVTARAEHADEYGGDGVLLVDLEDTDPDRARAACRDLLDLHGIRWEIRTDMRSTR